MVRTVCCIFALVILESDHSTVRWRRLVLHSSARVDVDPKRTERAQYRLVAFFLFRYKTKHFFFLTTLRFSLTLNEWDSHSSRKQKPAGGLFLSFLFFFLLGHVVRAFLHNFLWCWAATHCQFHLALFMFRFFLTRSILGRYFSSLDCTIKRTQSTTMRLWMEFIWAAD